MKHRKTKHGAVTVRLEMQDYNALRALAKRGHRSATAQARKFIIEALEREANADRNDT